MSDEWLDVAYINDDEAILHGTAVFDRDGRGVGTQRAVRVILTVEQKRAVEDLNFKHRMAMTKLLRGFVA